MALPYLPLELWEQIAFQDESIYRSLLTVCHDIELGLASLDTKTKIRYQDQFS